MRWSARSGAAALSFPTPPETARAKQSIENYKKGISMNFKLNLLTAAVLTLSPNLVAAAERSGSWTNDDIIVTGERQEYAAPKAGTATRTDTPIEKIPQSIQTLTRTFIDEQDLQTISDALVNVSGVAPSSSMEMVLQSPLIRGFSANYYFDGLPTYGLPSGISDPTSLINVERVEVAKGPTSTLYGGGAGAPLSGLINLVSRNPEQIFKGSVGVRAGSHNTIGGDADVNIPIIQDKLAFRINGNYEKADSFIDVVDSERFSVSPTLAWSISPQTNLTIRAQYNKMEQREYSGLPPELALPGVVGVDRFGFAGAEDAPRTSAENLLLTAELKHDFSENWTGSLAVRRYEGESKEYSTYPVAPFLGTTYFFGSGYLPSNTEMTFATASLTGKFGYGIFKHTVLVGADYDKTDYHGEMGLNLFWGVADFGSSALNAPYGVTPPVSDIQDDKMETLAFYAQDQMSIGDRLDITAGLRWTKLDVKSSYSSGGIPFVDTDESYYRVTPRIGATYKIVEGVSAFAGYAEGFKGTVAAFGVTDPKPETSQSYEGGLKLAGPIKGLSGTLALYEVTRQNVITADPLNPFASIQTGEQRARGFEADLVYEPDPALSLLLSFAHTDAKVTKDNTLPVGDKLKRVPENAGRLAARYRFQSPTLKGLEVGAGVTAVSDRELTLPNVVAVDGSTLFDAQASYAFGPASIAVSVVNLTDQDGFAPYNYFAGAAIPIQPRAAYVTLRANF